MIETCLNDLASSLLTKDSLKTLRKSAWEAFGKIGLPHKKSEDYQYFPLTSFYQSHFAEKKEFLGNVENHVFSESKESYLVFIDGEYREDLSNTKGLLSKPVILPLDEAIKSYGGFIQQRWAKELKEEKDPFCLANAALHEKGCFLFFPPKYHSLIPIQILHFTTGLVSFPRVEVVVGKEAEVNLALKTVTASSSFIHSAIFLSLDVSARVSYTSLIEEAESSFHFSSLRASLKKDATLTSISVMQGSKGTRQDYKVDLLGENATCDLSGMWMLAQNKQAAVNILINHLAPFTRSMQLFKGVLDDVSQSSFQGQIFVAKEAQKTEAYQLNNNVLLSERAIANAKPNLQIFADDVKASHGATISRLDKKQLFYLQSRGVPLKEASILLLRGFCNDVLEKIPFASIQQQALAELQKYLSYAAT